MKVCQTFPSPAALINAEIHLQPLNAVRHVSKKHKNTLTPELPISTVPIIDTVSSVDKDSDDNSTPTTVSVEESVTEFGKHMACCTLKLREKDILPASAVSKRSTQTLDR